MSEPVELALKAPVRRFRPYLEYKDSGVEWLGEIPKYWKVQRWRYLCRISEGQVAPDDERYSNHLLIAPNHVESGTGRILFTQTAQEQGASSGKYTVRAGDIIYSKIRPALNKVCIAEGDWLCSADMYPIRIVTRELSTPFLFYFMLSEPFVRFMVDESMRVAMPKINRETLSTCSILVPPVAEQVMINAFLRCETAKIDALVEKKERLIELLQEKRTALITQAVTKGLDPRVPMKDSGVEWLGEIPAHWECVQLSLITIARCDGPFGSALKSEHYTSSGVRVVRLQNIGWAQFRDEDRAYIEPAYASELGDHWIKAGDLLIGGLGDDRHPVGRTCVAPEGLGSAIVKADTFRFRVDNRRISPYFAAYQLSAGAEATSGSASTGSTRSRMNLSSTSSRKLAIPPLAEQKVIIDHIVATSEKLDELAGKVLEGIDRLRELRTALISAAVTGKIDVRGEVS